MSTTTTLLKSPIVVAAFMLAVAALPAAAHDVRPANATETTTALSTASGTVTELTVDNQVTGVSLRYLGLRMDDGHSVAITGVNVDTLAKGDRISATGTLNGEVMRVSSFARTGAAANGKVTAQGSPTQLQGTLRMFHIDYFDLGRGEYGLAIASADGRTTRLNVAVIANTLEPGMRIIASGTLSADANSLDTTAISIVGLAPLRANDVTPQSITNKVLVLPIKFSDSPADSFTPDQINTEFQTRVAPFVVESSFGNQQLNITVACSSSSMLPGCTTNQNTLPGGWLNGRAATPGPSSGDCGWAQMGTLADAAATAAGYNLGSYDNKYYVLPGNSGCGWAGLAYVGVGLAWSANANGLWVYGHELGHNFGLWHAGNVDCGSQVIGSGCGVGEYGDRFDIMGNVRQMHYNAMQKQRLNWIPGASVKTHTSGTQTYQLSPLEVGGQPTYAVKIPTSNPNRTYWVEFRQPIGFDSPLSTLPNLGAQIRVQSPFESTGGADDTELLDMTPGDGNFDNATLLVTAPAYVDSSTGVTISVNSATPGSSGLLTVTVALGGTTSATTTTLSASPNPSASGASVTFTATVNGSAPTGTVSFTSDGSALCSSVAFSGGSANAKTATCSSSTLAAGSHSIVATYSGDAANQSSFNAPALSQTVNGGGGGSDVVWVEDSVPSGAVQDGLSEGWTWVSSSPAPFSGTLAHQSAVISGVHQHYFYNASATLTINTGDTLYAYVYLDPANPPNEVTLQWNDGSWEHRAYWGANVSTWGSDGTNSRRYMGALPAAGQWVRLSVPAALVGLEGRTLNGMAFTLYGGRATWDRAGKSSGTSSSPTTTSLASSSNPANAGVSVTFTATVNGTAPTGTVNFTADGSALCSSVAFTGGTANARSAACSTSTLATGNHSIVATYSGDAANQSSFNAPALAQTINAGTEVVWVDDSSPVGAVQAGLGEGWNWVSSNPTPFSGALAHQSALMSGIHQHYFYDTSATMTVSTGDTLFAYVYLDPVNPPSEVTLQWNDGSWEHRAYWGANLNTWGVDGTVSRRYMGALPAAGQWVRLAVPASLVGLEGRTLNGMAFTLYDGRATWDRAGKSTSGSGSPTTTTLVSSLNPASAGVSVNFTATVNGTAPTGTVNFTADGSPLCSSVAFSGGSANAKTATCSSSTLAAGNHSIVATYTGDAANQASFNAPALSQTINAGADIVWIDDTVPAGAVQAGDGDGWTWVSSNPASFSGALAHQSALLSGIHQHYFYNATSTMSVGTGDTLYAYVYLDPANPPSEVTLQWNDGSWEHRAYWGANLNTWGVDGTNSRRYMGALPAAGQWVRLDVPAALVGLEGRTLNGMAFTLFNGRATWDQAGKHTP